MKLTVRIAGEAGQGLVTAGDLLVKLLTAYNVHIFTNRAYMSRIRGGLNWYDITVSEEKVYSPSETSDFLIALSEDSLAVL
ncbi:MAG: 2-oxoacid:acceptor oxidoreductase family protein [Victivallales bacterium]|nr:2-oxoacid:acceptor oxidoreductase family protein [Victivallales bacterium]